jgi:hypothetical protein
VTAHLILNRLERDAVADLEVVERPVHHVPPVEVVEIALRSRKRGGFTLESLLAFIDLLKTFIRSYPAEERLYAY